MMNSIAEYILYLQSIDNRDDNTSEETRSIYGTLQTKNKGRAA